MIHLIRVLTFFDENAVPFETDLVFTKLREAFPEAQLENEDPYVARAKYYEEQFEKLGQKDNIVIQSAWRDVDRFSPAYSFILPQTGTQPLYVKVDRYCASFSCQNKILEDLRKRIFDFLESLHSGKVEEILEEG